MNTLDYAVVAPYFVVVITAGAWYARRASQDIDAYFLGGKRMSWLALSMSGSVSNFDITGTMWIVSMLMLLGMAAIMSLYLAPMYLVGHWHLRAAACVGLAAAACAALYFSWYRHLPPPETGE